MAELSKDNRGFLTAFGMTAGSMLPASESRYPDPSASLNAALGHPRSLVASRGISLDSCRARNLPPCGAFPREQLDDSIKLGAVCAEMIFTHPCKELSFAAQV